MNLMFPSCIRQTAFAYAPCRPQGLWDVPSPWMFSDKSQRLYPLTRARIDVIVALYVFGLPRDELAYVLETFP
jgi:hypothetical protein